MSRYYRHGNGRSDKFVRIAPDHALPSHWATQLRAQRTEAEYRDSLLEGHVNEIMMWALHSPLMPFLPEYPTYCFNWNEV